MAEALCGPHWLITCRDCRLPFRCGTEYPPSQYLAMCPNCGCPDLPLDTALRVPGQRVLIDRGARVLGGLRPWQVVAVRPPDDAPPLSVKRLVAAGPGRLEIRDGDVFVDGHIRQKSLAQLRELRLLVHDDRYRSPLGNRWQPGADDSHWTTTPAGYAYSPPSSKPDTLESARPTRAAAAPDGRVDWLHYRQWTCWPHGSPDVGRTQSVPLLDHDPYNQSLSRGNLHPVCDIMLCCHLQISGTGTCVVRLTSRGDEFDWEIGASEPECSLWWNGSCVARARRSGRPPPWTLEMAVCDHRVLAALDQVELFQFDYTPRTSDLVSHELERLSVGAKGVSVQLEALQVFRDIHYLGPGAIARWRYPRPLEAGQWFVLGDNVPLSIDSRLWAALDDRAIIGPVRW